MGAQPPAGKRRAALLEILAVALQLERDGRHVFLELAKRAKDRRARRMLRRLAAEELEHFGILEETFNEVRGPDTWLTAQEVAARYGKRLLQLAPVKRVRRVRKATDRSMTEHKALALGITSEMESLAFYRKAARIEKDSVYRDLLLDFVAFEEGHLRILETERANLDRITRWARTPRRRR